MSLTGELTELIHTKPIGDADLAMAASYALDAVACALAAAPSPVGRLLRDWAAAQGQDAGRRAFLLAALVHTLEMDDLHKASVVHPGCVVVPAAWALAERDGRSGRDFLVAVLHGYEACCRVGMAVGPAHYRLWHNTATCGPFGSAMAAATLSGASPPQTLDALGNAGTQSAGFWEFLDSGAMSKHLHAGRAAEAGVVAADLALRGFTGPPRILEGRRGLFAACCPDADPGAVLRRPADPWQLGQTSIKPWPSCRHTHPAVDAALALHERLGGRAWRRARVRTYSAALEVCDRPDPDSAYAAKFSLQHCVAAALVRGALDFDCFEADGRQTLAEARARVELAAEERFAAAYPRAWGAQVSLELDGQEGLEASREHCLGDPELPLSPEQIRRKAVRLLLAGGIEQQRAERFAAALEDLAGAPRLPPLPLTLP